jgi:hypothetical protein
MVGGHLTGRFYSGMSSLRQSWPWWWAAPEGLLHLSPPWRVGDEDSKLGEPSRRDQSVARGWESILPRGAIKGLASPDFCALAASPRLPGTGAQCRPPVHVPRSWEDPRFAIPGEARIGALLLLAHRAVIPRFGDFLVVFSSLWRGKALEAVINPFSLVHCGRRDRMCQPALSAFRCLGTWNESSSLRK